METISEEDEIEGKRKTLFCSRMEVKGGPNGTAKAEENMKMRDNCRFSPQNVLSPLYS